MSDDRVAFLAMVDGWLDFLSVLFDAGRWILAEGLSTVGRGSRWILAKGLSTVDRKS